LQVLSTFLLTIADFHPHHQEWALIQEADVETQKQPFFNLFSSARAHHGMALFCVLVFHSAFLLFSKSAFLFKTLRLPVFDHQKRGVFVCQCFELTMSMP
jgi:hypothetical protein